MSVELGKRAAPGNRWRWVWLALLPGIVSDAMFAGHIVLNTARSDALVALGVGLLCGAGLLPLVAPLYLIELGRRYVRAVHGGYQSVTPFVLITGAANAILWFGGVLFVLASFGYR